MAAIGVRDRNTDRLETLTRDPGAIFSLEQDAAFSNWLFQQQYRLGHFFLSILRGIQLQLMISIYRRWEEEFDPKQRATTAALGLKEKMKQGSSNDEAKDDASEKPPQSETGETAI